MAGTKFLRTEKHKDKQKTYMALLRCHGDSDCNKAQIIIYNNIIIFIDLYCAHVNPGKEIIICA